MVTLRPRDLRRRPRDEAVSPLPSDDATPPVTNTCLVGVTGPTTFSRGGQCDGSTRLSTGFKSIKTCDLAGKPRRGYAEWRLRRALQARRQHHGVAAHAVVA